MRKQLQISNFKLQKANCKSRSCIQFEICSLQFAICIFQINFLCNLR